MKIKLDENLPLRLANLLKDLGHDVCTVHEERLVGHNDREIWEAAQSELRFLLYPRFGFLRLAAVCSGSHYGILLIRLHSPNRRSLVARIAELFQKENVADWVRCFVVATERKIRVLKPESKQNS